jgi:hypothetical protein
MTAAGSAAGSASDSSELNFAPRSQHEARALASMVVASLPFPPLPVVVLQGEDGADGLASSFDLLQTAVLNTHLGLSRTLTIQLLADAYLHGRQYWITNDCEFVGIYVPVCIQFTFQRHREHLLGEDALDITLTRELDTQKFTPVHVYATLPNMVSNEARCAEGVRYR